MGLRSSTTDQVDRLAIAEHVRFVRQHTTKTLLLPGSAPPRSTASRRAWDCLCFMPWLRNCGRAGRRSGPPLARVEGYHPGRGSRWFPSRRQQEILGSVLISLLGDPAKNAHQSARLDFAWCPDALQPQPDGRFNGYSNRRSAAKAVGAELPVGGPITAVRSVGRGCPGAGSELQPSRSSQRSLKLSGVLNATKPSAMADRFPIAVHIDDLSKR